VKEHCGKFREILENLISRDLPPEEREAVDRHLVDCTDCRVYYESLVEDDGSLGAFAASMEGLGSRIQDAVFRAHEPELHIIRTKTGLWGRPAVRVAAAVAVIAVIVLVSNLFDSSPRRDVVWAEVFEKIENPPSYIANSTTIHDGQIKHEAVMYYSPEFGWRRDTYRSNALDYQSIANLQVNRCYDIKFTSRTCVTYQLSQYRRESLRKNWALGRVERLKKRDHVSLGLGEMEGVVVAGIAIVDTVSRKGSTTVATTRIYVDVSTQWPVVMEGEGVTANPDGSTHHRLTRSTYQWQPQLTQEDFAPNISDDFFVADLSMPIEQIIEGATAGLRNFARITGRYPANLDFGTLRLEIAAELEEQKRKEAYAPEIADSLNAVMRAGVLARWKDRVARYYRAGEFPYYDSSVSPADSEKVLYRWRMDDKVGIIYGDLRFGTGDASQFAEFDTERYKLEDEQRRNGANDPSQ
jgi:hypothetical protein